MTDDNMDIVMINKIHEIRDKIWELFMPYPMFSVSENYDGEGNARGELDLFVGIDSFRLRKKESDIHSGMNYLGDILGYLSVGVYGKKYIADTIDKMIDKTITFGCYIIESEAFIRYIGMDINNGITMMKITRHYKDMHPEGTFDTFIDWLNESIMDFLDAYNYPNYLSEEEIDYRNSNDISKEIFQYADRYIAPIIDELMFLVISAYNNSHYQHSVEEFMKNPHFMTDNALFITDELYCTTADFRDAVNSDDIRCYDIVKDAGWCYYVTYVN